MRVALSAMACSRNRLSEAFVAYNWLYQISRYHTVDLITAETDPPTLDNVSIHYVQNQWWPLRFVPHPLRGSAKPDYFVFDRRSGRQCANIVAQTDVFHHVVPQAPRYPSSLGRKSNRFILGPIGGGLRVPQKFRHLIEANEPIYSRLRNMDSIRFRYDPWLRKTYQSADMILLTAPYMLDILPEEYHAKVEFIAETGIDAQLYAEETPHRAASKDIKILYVGRLTPYKGLEFLIRAFAKLPPSARQNTRVHVVGVGSPDYEMRCRKIAAELGIASRIVFYGRRPKEEVHDHYRRADIFCFPTLAETTGNVLLEAMAMGLPIISTNYGGPAAVVRGDSGFLVNPHSPNDFINGLAAAMQKLVYDKNLRLKMGARAQEHVITSFSWAEKGRQICDLYNRVVENSGPV